LHTERTEHNLLNSKNQTHSKNIVDRTVTEIIFNI